MSILPTVAHGPNEEGSILRPNNPKPPLIFQRLTKFQSMDFELASWQLTYLCLSPRRVYRNVYFHKQTKNTWARDDPAIHILICACLCVSAIAWSIIYSYSPQQAVLLALEMIFRDFLLVGAVIATMLWLVGKRLVVKSPTSPANQSVEWAYGFDVHLNSFFPSFLWLYIAQLFLAGVITKENWLCLWVGNTLYLVAFAQYFYGLYLGMNALPFLARTELMLAPLVPLFVGYIVSLLGFNVGKFVLSVYFE